MYIAAIVKGSLNTVKDDIINILWPRIFPTSLELSHDFWVALRFKIPIYVSLF